MQRIELDNNFSNNLLNYFMSISPEEIKLDFIEYSKLLKLVNCNEIISNRISSESGNWFWYHEKRARLVLSCEDFNNFEKVFLSNILQGSGFSYDAHYRMVANSVYRMKTGDYIEDIFYPDPDFLDEVDSKYFPLTKSQAEDFNSSKIRSGLIIRHRKFGVGVVLSDVDRSGGAVGFGCLFKREKKSLRILVDDFSGIINPFF